MRRIALTAVVVFAFAAPAASAAPSRAHHKHRTALSIALKHAYQLWGVKPCGGHYRVELTANLPSWAGGHSDWNSPAGRDTYASPPSTWTNCVMELPVEQWTTYRLVQEWPSNCTAVLHEWGHLTGHPHSDEPGAPPEPPGTTSEQRKVMAAGAGFQPEDDMARCGWSPHERTPDERERHLTEAQAVAAIVASERNHLHDPTVEVKVYPCQRRSQTAIRCAFEDLDPAKWGHLQLNGTDEAVLAHGRVAVYASPNIS